jgi:tetratricopeptide (TPR) repeat protein
MKQYLLTFAVFFLLQTVTVFAGGKQEPPSVSNLVSLEDALAGAVTSVEGRTRSGDKIALAKIASPLSSLSDFLGSELDSRFSTTGKLTVLARGQTLEQVNTELEFQMSGLVDDESAVGIGHYLGAKMVITGDFNQFSNFSQLYIRAIDVETARVLVTYSAKIDNRDRLLTGLIAPLQQTRTTTVNEAALEHLNLGKDYLAAGIPDIAIEEFNRALRGNRNFAEALFYRGTVYTVKGDNNQAIADFTAALKINSNYTEALVDRANAYNMRGLENEDNKDYDQAIADCTAVLRIDPNNVSALWVRGNAYGLKDDYNRAIAEYTAALRIDPNHVRLYTVRAFTYERKGDLDQAIADYTEALRIDPDDIWGVYYDRAQAYESKGDLDQAIADYTEALRIHPDRGYYYTSRAEVYEDKGDLDLAIADYTAAVRVDPDYVWAYISRGDAYKSKGDYDRAIADYTAAMRVDPNNVYAYLHRGDMYYELGYYYEAELDYEEVGRIDPKNAFFKYDLEKVRKAQGRSNSTYTTSPSVYLGYSIGYVRAFDSENSGMFENSGITLSMETFGLSVDSLFSVDYLLGPMRQRYWVEESDNHVSYRQGDIVEHSLVLGLALGFPIAHIFTIYAGGGLGFTWNPDNGSSGSSSPDPAYTYNDTPPEPSIELAWKVNAGLRLQYAGLFVKFDVSYGTILGPSFGIGIGVFQ